MRISRVSNAGVLLELDGVSILMDGVCREVKPYPATPSEVKKALTEHFPDLVAFTHAHKDHYDPDYAAEYEKQTGGVILGPEDLPHSSAVMQPRTLGAVTVMPIPSRHIGAAGKITPHASFVISGSWCVWFTGDAAPTQWRQCDLPKPDLLIVPYAYAATPSAWEMTKAFRPKKIVLLHLPDRNADPYDLWQTVERTMGREFDTLLIPQLGESLYLE